METTSFEDLQLKPTDIIHHGFQAVRAGWQKASTGFL
jgi:hypothetical protein